jgi:hypothetical protein
MGGGGNVNVNLQKLADLGAYTDKLMPDKATSIGALTTDASKAGADTVVGAVKDVAKGAKTALTGGEEAKILRDAEKRRKELEAGLEGLLGVLGREY